MTNTVCIHFSMQAKPSLPPNNDGTLVNKTIMLSNGQSNNDDHTFPDANSSLRLTMPISNGCALLRHTKQSWLDGHLYWQNMALNCTIVHVTSIPCLMPCRVTQLYSNSSKTMIVHLLHVPSLTHCHPLPPIAVSWLCPFT